MFVQKVLSVKQNVSLENKIYLNIKNGKVTDIDGKIEAKKLNKILSDTNFPSSYVVAEFAIG
ncbi:MAG TPA: hypothetical protein PKI83_06760, partial [Bacteroidales bacterium]|nr:hypothetical protein [Bacteroidales bacterium]